MFFFDHAVALQWRDRSFGGLSLISRGLFKEVLVSILKGLLINQ